MFQGKDVSSPATEEWPFPRRALHERTARLVHNTESIVAANLRRYSTPSLRHGGTATFEFRDSTRHLYESPCLVIVRCIDRSRGKEAVVEGLT